jgi:hypothetical protein
MMPQRKREELIVTLVSAVLPVRCVLVYMRHSVLEVVGRLVV